MDFWQHRWNASSQFDTACQSEMVDRLMDTKKLIEEVLLDLGNNKSLTEVSSKIQIIVRLLGDEKLKDWYTCEFVTGYKDQNLPDYRISQAADIQANYLVPHGFGAISFRGQSVPVMNLGTEKYKEIMTVRFTDTISAIIGYSKHPEDISMSLSPYELILVQKVLGEAHIQSVHKVLSPSTFQTIIDNVQGRIIDMFMDLNERVFNGELDLKSNTVKKEIHQVINNNITARIVQTGTGTIEANNSTIAATLEQELSAESISKLTTLTDDVERLAKESNEEFNDIAQEIVDIRTELSKQKPNIGFLKKSFKALTWGATVSCKTAIEEIVKKAIELLS